MLISKKEQLENLKRENARERAEVRDNEWFIRDGEDSTMQMIRDNMARTLANAEITPEERREKLAAMKDEIDRILDSREDREHDFIEQELQRHQVEQELELEIEKETATEPKDDSINIMFRARSSLNAGAERMRKEIEEKSKQLNDIEEMIAWLKTQLM